MAIMVGGGLTFAIPGMEPAHAQVQSNPNLIVSADGLGGNEIAATNIVEVIINDPDNNESDDNLRVTVDGTELNMRWYSGSWYGYFADTDILTSGLITQSNIDGVDTTVRTDADRLVDRQVIDNLVKDENTFTVDPPLMINTDGVDGTVGDVIDPTTLADNKPLVQLIDLSDDFSVTYHTPIQQTVNLEYDDPDSSVSLDRETYPKNTGVVITIDDQALNVDPTDTDVWWFGDDGTAYYNSVPTKTDAAATRDAAIEMAKGVRDGKIMTANGTRNDSIAEANADSFETAATTKLGTTLQRAQEVVDDTTTYTPEQRTRAASLLPNTETFGVGGTPTEFSDPPEATEIIAYKGLAQVEYEVTHGFEAIGTEVTALDDTAAAAYITAVNRALANYYLGTDISATLTEANLADLDVRYYTETEAQEILDNTTTASENIVADGVAPIQAAEAKNKAQKVFERTDGMGDSDVGSDPDSENYKGSAHIAYERIAGNQEDTAQTAANNERASTLTAGTVPDDYRGDAWIVYDLAIADDVVKPYSAEIAAGETFSITKNNQGGTSLVDCANTCKVIDDEFLLMFEESDTNDSTFTNSPGDTPNLDTVANASRGLSFTVDYGDESDTANIGFVTTTIVIDAGDDWNSGQTATVTLTDSDANTNSLTEDDLQITNPKQTIPTIKVGNPFTLAEAESSDAYDVMEVSDILVTNTAATYSGSQTMTIELGQWSDIKDYLPADEAAFVGTNLLNYDVSKLPNAETISIKIGAETIPIVKKVVSDGRDTVILTDADFNLDDPKNDFAKLYDEKGIIRDFDGATASLEIGFSTISTVPAGAAIVIDLFSFGLAGGENNEPGNDNVNNAIYRLELEEANSNSSDFTGTLEYVALTQMNILERSTYDDITSIGVDVVLISDDSSISIEYRDLDATGGYTTFTAEADTPTHSGVIKLDSDAYKASDTVIVTVEDADLNADSAIADTYTVSAGDDTITSTVDDLFTVSFDSNPWIAGCEVDGVELGGLHDSQFTLKETGKATGVFSGTFSIPAEYCAPGDLRTSVSGTDVTVDYVDFRDDSGSTISVSASAGIRSTTGSVSLDRTVYPVPFGANATTDTIFKTSNDENPHLAQGDLTVYVSVTDSDADTSANGIDSIDAFTVMMEIIRGSAMVEIDTGDGTISETAPDSGVFELEMSIAYDAGPLTDDCPARLLGCILQGDILHVVYTDQSDASGSENTVTDSATFDLRNGVLQSDQTAYIIGSDAIITLIEPDLNLDSDATETYTLDLIEWDSDAGTATLDAGVFSATPSNLLETGTDTGIFQVVVGIPPEIGNDKLERGEEITLEYVDWGPSGSDYVGDKDESITTTIYTSNFGATVELDQRVYTWTDKVYITVVAPDHNIDSDQVDEIGVDDDYPIRVSTRGNDIDQYKLVETGADTGIFTGEIILTGFPTHDADGDGKDGDATGRTSDEGSGPTNGEIKTESESGISVSFKYSDGETVSSSALIRWNVGEVQWLEASYPASGSGIVRVIDPDMNLNPEAVDNFDATVFSDSDGGGISLTVTETNAATGIFEGTVFFGVGVDTSGHRLRVVEGDTVTAQYYDNTLPAPFKETERVRIGATTLIGTIVPPLERVPISDLRAVDSFGSTLDTISVDSQIQLAADLTNGQDKSQDFAYLIQIQDGNGVTVSLNWITGSLTAGQSLSPATSWTPTEAGTYEVTAFAWESIENPTALSPTSTITITVN